MLYVNEHYEEILFTHEKKFILEETFNKQNDRVYAWLSKEVRELVPRIKQGHYPASVIVWWDGIISLHFCEKDGKKVTKNYQWNIFKNVVEPLNQTMFQIRPWIFQNHFAPAYNAKNYAIT